jgi:TRAP-type C4-dicarboxylate transport system substrate-binding protein
MKKFKQYCAHLAIGFTAILMAVNGACADYEYKWKLATTEAPDYYMTQLSQKFIDKVNERTGGKVTGQVFASGQLGNLIGALEGLNMGNIDIVMDGVSSLSEANKLFNVFGIAYLYDSKEHQYRFWDKYFKEITDYIAKESGYRLVAVIDGMSRQLSPKKPIRSLADVKPENPRSHRHALCARLAAFRRGASHYVLQRGLYRAANRRRGSTRERYSPDPCDGVLRSSPVLRADQPRAI